MGLDALPLRNISGNALGTELLASLLSPLLMDLLCCRLCPIYIGHTSECARLVFGRRIGHALRVLCGYLQCSRGCLAPLVDIDLCRHVNGSVNRDNHLRADISTDISKNVFIGQVDCGAHFLMCAGIRVSVYMCGFMMFCSNLHDE